MAKQLPIFFFHIPKTAGSSMQWLLSRHFAQNEIAPAGNLTTLLRQGSDKLVRQKLFQGHFYGSVENIVGQQCFRFTLLRDPIERALSHYGHVLRDCNHYLHQRAVELNSLEAYLDDGITQMTVSNFQARMLALELDIESVWRGLTDEQRSNWYLERYLETTNFGFQNHKVLTAAQSKLESFEVVGITERFTETLALLCYKLGWEYPMDAQIRNVNEQRPCRSTLLPSTMRRLVELNEIDIALYEEASSAFEINYRRMVAEVVSQHARKSLMKSWIERIYG